MSLLRIVKVDEIGNPTTITVSNNLNVNTANEIIALEDSCLELKGIDSNKDNRDAYLPVKKKAKIESEEDSIVIIEDKLLDTIVHFEKTLQPGVAPEGFLLIDEDVNTSSVDTIDNVENINSIAETKSTKPKPLIQIKFRDDSAIRKYKVKIEDFFKRLINDKKTLDFSLCERELKIYDFGQEDKDYSLNDSLFTIDTELAQQVGLGQPMFKRKFKETLGKLNEISKNEVKATCKQNLPQSTCLANTSAKGCKTSFNNSPTTKQRNDYNARIGLSNISRYHLENDFTPGKLSPELRKALGIKDNELPPYIYRMRNLGYPPGWLEEAKVQQSGLALFNSDGLPDGNSTSEEDKYDVNKLIDFPGFNVAIPSATKDCYRSYWGSALQIINSKETMLQYYSTKTANEGYKKKKLQNATAVLKVSQNNSDPVDMYIKKPEELLSNKEILTTPICKDNLSSKSLSLPLPIISTKETSSVVILEDSDIQLQGSINLGEVYTSTPLKTQPLRELDAKKRKSLSVMEETYFSTNNSNDNSLLDSDTSTPVNNDSCIQHSEIQNSKSKSVKNVILGTPILKGCSEYKNRPPSTNFSKNICDVINFENLPNSVGKYNNLVHILKKVRTTLDELHKE